MHNVHRESLLSAAEEVELAQAIEVGRAAQQRFRCAHAQPDDHDALVVGHRARDRFVRANIGLAIHLANQTSSPAHVDREDVVQDAFVGLSRAVDRFDWRRGNRFSTYASWWIRQAIQQGRETCAAPVRIPIHATRELHQALGESSGESTQLSSRVAATLAMTSMDSLEGSKGVGGSRASKSLRAANSDPAEIVARNHDQRVAVRLMNQLDPTTKYAVGRRFGFDGDDPATLTEIGNDLGVCAEAARRRIGRALNRLKPIATTLAA